MTGVLKAITKAIIPAAGFGRRLSPITSVLPKEMFPIGCHPAIEWVIVEAVASGCTDLAIVISPRKRMIAEYLTSSCAELANLCRVSFLVQPKPLGLAHALLLAREFCAGEPFAVLLPDLLIEGPELALVEMIPVLRAKGGAVFALAEESTEKAKRDGGFQLQEVSERIYRVEAIFARPTFVKALSVLVGVGRYLFSPECLDYTATLMDQTRTGEFDDGVILQHMLGIGEAVHAVNIAGRRHDISTPDGYIAAWERFGMERPNFKLG
jgi:UTP--glucose-1-phosphate uridylyltransferase